MASLSAHLRQAGDHGALTFHPECPICRDERLVGTLPADALVSRRTQALFAAGVLALSSAPSAAALVQEPDQEQEGSAAPDQATVADPAGDPDFDPGGESTDLPFDAGPTPDAPVAPETDDDETGALEQEPTTNEDAPIADAGDETSAVALGEQQAPSTTGTAPPPPPAAVQTPESAASTPAPEVPAATPAPSNPEADSPAQRRAVDEREERSRRSHVDQASQTDAAAPAPAPVVAASDPGDARTVYVVQGPSTSNSGSNAVRERARAGDRVHVVAPGESLWSIASDVLGDSASVAKIAREVNRLWELNSERIGTGDRDLLLVGTRLALR